MYSFMDGFSGSDPHGHNRQGQDSLHHRVGVYYYRVMPFRLKNVRATYQRVVTTLLHDMIHKEVEVYMDDMLVKSNTREKHAAILDRFLTRVEKYNLRLNPKKCVSGLPPANY